MAKRKAEHLDATTLPEQPRRSSRRVATHGAKAEKTAGEKPSTSASSAAKGKRVKKEKETQGPVVKREVSSTKDESGLASGRDTKPPQTDTPKAPLPVPATSSSSSSSPSPARQYWLMKAEPESRLEKGHDIKFSIDDLAAKTAPEPWDGIRAYPARNNLRAMQKGDLAFFYHSSCKTPCIVGTMEITHPASPDLTAHDPNAPYYDATSSPSSPKWSMVHVAFRQKLSVAVTLQQLKALQAQADSPLAEMQMLRLPRMSVSRVREAEWRFLVDVMRGNGDLVDER